MEAINEVPLIVSGKQQHGISIFSRLMDRLPPPRSGSTITQRRHAWVPDDRRDHHQSTKRNMQLTLIGRESGEYFLSIRYIIFWAFLD
jgi:hypothetical protein